MAYWVVKLHQTGPEPRSITKYFGPFSTEEEAEKKRLEAEFDQIDRLDWNKPDAYLPQPKVEVWTDERIALARAGGHYIY